MLAVLRENWKYKLLALVCAIALHSYVVGQNTESQPRTLIRQLTLKGAAPDLIVNQQALPQISITLDGPADEMARIADTAVLAYVDLSHAHAGQNASLTVHVSLPPGTSPLVTADPQPSVVPVPVDTKAHRRLPVAANEPGTPPAGYAFRAPQITPKRALIEGGHEAVASVQQLVVKAEEETIGTVDDTFPIVALDSDGTQVEGITITPATAHVRIEMVRVPATRMLVVSPAIIGTPAYPARVTDVQVSPPSLLVTGHADRLAQVGTLSTVPIDVSGATGDVVRQTACVPPPGLTLVSRTPVTVTVRISAPPPSPITEPTAPIAPPVAAP